MNLNYGNFPFVRKHFFRADSWGKKHKQISSYIQVHCNLTSVFLQIPGWIVTLALFTRASPIIKLGVGLVAKSCPTPVTPWTVAHQVVSPWDSPGKNTGEGCHFLLQGIFPTKDQTCICYIYLHCQVGSLPLAPPGKPIIRSAVNKYELKSQKEGTYLWRIHVDIQQKPTQYCKAIILQLKIN